jgi:hypothetical protein
MGQGQIPNARFLVANHYPGQSPHFQARVFDTLDKAAEFVAHSPNSGHNPHIHPVPTQAAESLLAGIRSNPGGMAAWDASRNFMGQFSGASRAIQEAIGAAAHTPLGHAAKHLVSGRVQAAVAVGSVAALGLSTAASAHEAGDDLPTSARKGVQASYHDVVDRAADTVRASVHRVAKGADEIGHGRIEVGAARVIEGVGTFIGLGDVAEHARVQPAAEKVFEERGARALADEVIRYGENPKYVISGNTSFPDEMRMRDGRTLPIEDALSDPDVRAGYRNRLEQNIASGAGDREVWESQLESLRGFERAQAAMREHEPQMVAAPAAQPNPMRPS